MTKCYNCGHPEEDHKGDLLRLCPGFNVKCEDDPYLSYERRKMALREAQELYVFTPNKTIH